MGVPEFDVAAGDWPVDLLPSSRVAHDDYSRGDQIPVIDLSNLQCKNPNRDDIKCIADQMVSASKEWGFFQVVNHGVPQKVVERARAGARSLFALPLEKKVKVKRVGNGNLAGYGNGTAVMNFQFKGAWSEAFTVMNEPLPGTPAEYAKKIWPEGNPDFSEGLQDFMTQVRKLYKQLLALLMIEGLGVSPEFLPEDSAVLRLNYYPPCPDPSKYVGLPEHADGTILTLLHQSEVGGLQVLKDGKWSCIRPRPDCFCVNVGDIGQVMSNGILKSARHAAVVNESKSRLSIVLACKPGRSVLVHPAPEMIDERHPVMYKSFTWDEYLVAKVNHSTDALADLRLNPQPKT